MLIIEFDQLITLTDKFYYAFREQWMKENKPHGFDVQDIRIGAFLMRLRHCRERIKDFLEGKTDIIEELEEILLDPLGGGKNYSQKPIEYNTWGRIVTANLNYGD